MQDVYEFGRQSHGYDLIRRSHEGKLWWTLKVGPRPDQHYVDLAHELGFREAFVRPDSIQTSLLFLRPLAPEEGG